MKIFSILGLCLSNLANALLEDFEHVTDTALTAGDEL